MRSKNFTSVRFKSGLAAAALLMAGGAAFGQVALTAKPTSTLLPDGQSVPMWGLFCAPGSNTDLTLGPTCTALNGAAQTGTSGQPPLIKKTTGAAITITLTT